MKKQLGLVAIGGLIVVSLLGAVDHGALVGQWSGTLRDGEKVVLVELDIRQEHPAIEGTFMIASETGEDIDKGMTFPILQAEWSSKGLTFTVPVTGEIDNDSIAFELAFDGIHLIGHLREIRLGKEVPVVFTRLANDTVKHTHTDEDTAYFDSMSEGLSFPMMVGGFLFTCGDPTNDDVKPTCAAFVHGLIAAAETYSEGKPFCFPERDRLSDVVWRVAIPGLLNSVNERHNVAHMQAGPAILVGLEEVFSCDGN